MSAAREQQDFGLGYVVDNKEARVRFAVSAANFNPKRHVKVRPLQPGETVRGFSPRRLSKTAETTNPALPQGPK